MSLQKIIEKIKTYLVEEIPVEVPVEEPDMNNIKTKDGIILSFNGELAVGVEIFVVDETGNIPAPDSWTILENGQTIKIIDGKVAEIIEAEPVEEAPEVVEEMAEPEAEPKLEEKVAELENQIQEIFGILQEIVGDMNKNELEKEIKTEMAKEKPEIKLEKNTKKQKTTNTVENILFNMYKNN
jgi:hypothetical protein